MQIPKLSLVFQFDHDLIEKTRKQSVAFLMISTVCTKSCLGVTQFELCYTNDFKFFHAFYLIDIIFQKLEPLNHQKVLG